MTKTIPFNARKFVDSVMNKLVTSNDILTTTERLFMESEMITWLDEHIGTFFYMQDNAMFRIFHGLNWTLRYYERDEHLLVKEEHSGTVQFYKVPEEKILEFVLRFK